MGHANGPLLVFVHGYLGFVGQPLPSALRYFRGLATEMRRHGHACLFPAVPRTESVAERAAAVAAALKGTGDGPVVVVGHSMGGLDARYLAHKLDPEGRVHAVVTVGTPHRGSPVADWALAGALSFPWSLIARRCPALEALTPEACAARNAWLTDRPGVAYLSCAGERPESEFTWPLAGYARRMRATHGVNDGLVPVTSAKWGRFLGARRADHFELIGWRLPWSIGRGGASFDHLALYRSLIAEALAARDVAGYPRAPAGGSGPGSATALN